MPLFIFALGHDNSYIHPAHLYAKCGALQAAFQLILVQMARLHECGQTDYKPWPRMDMNSLTSADAEYIDFSENDEDDGRQLEQLLPVNYDDPLPSLSLQSCSDNLMATQFILENMPYISSSMGDNLTTPFKRMKSVSSALYASAHAASLRHANVTCVDHVIQVAYLGVDPVHLDVAKWMMAAAHSISEYEDSVLALVPPDISLAQFPFHCLTDDFSRDAVLKQRQNAEWLDPLRGKVQHRIFQHFNMFSTSGINAEACVRWLEAEQSSLKHLAVVVGLTCGISPPQHEYRVFYDSTPSETRGIWILPNQIVIWVNPMARPKDNDLLPGVYMFPALSAPIVMFFITVLRPIACQVVRSLSRDDLAYLTEIWAHFRRQRHGKYHWVGPEISAPIEQYTLTALGTSFGPDKIWMLLHAIFCHYLPDLVKQTLDSIVDKAAQHVSMTSLRYYGRSASYPPLKHLRFDQPMWFIALAQIWQTILGLELPSITAKTQLRDVGLMPCCPWSSDGLQHACIAIQHYGKLSNPAAARLLLSQLPYVYGPNATPASRAKPQFVLGDEVLVKVTRSIIQDVEQFSSSEYSILVQPHRKTEVVAHAMTMITRALNELCRTNFVDLTSLSIKSMLQYSKIYRHFADIVAAFMQEHPDHWAEFNNKVSGVA